MLKEAILQDCFSRGLEMGERRTFIQVGRELSGESETDGGSYSETGV